MRVPCWLIVGLLGCAESFAYDVAEKSLSDLQADLTAGRVTSEQLVAAYTQRIEKLDRNGPTLRSVISVNPEAGKQARQLDLERRAGNVRSPLHGIPVMLKDNIESADPMPTTAGTSALKANFSARDSALAARLRAAGAIILGKTNLGSWSEIQSMNAISGWSAVGGLVRNPYVLDRTACGSSSGSGAATAASLTAVAIGTETDNSIICPSAMNGLVGLKPTVGLVSRSGIVPISNAQDTAGPMARSVEDLATLLDVIAGSDPKDSATSAADARKSDYSGSLKQADLSGRRLGVLTFALGRSPQVDKVFAQALTSLRKSGAEIVELTEFQPPPGLRASELRVMLAEFKVNLSTYLATTPATVEVKSLADVIAYNLATERELALFGQDLLEAAQATSGTSDVTHVKSSEEIKRLAGLESIDKLLTTHRLDALIAPSAAPPGRIDTIRGDHPSLGVSNLPAVAGYPHLTVPMGDVGPLPVGLSFIGAAWSERTLLQLGAAFERATRVRRPPQYLESIEAKPPALNILGNPSN